MEWIKLQLHVIRSEQYIGCEPVHRAAYINLLAYCVDQENSGIIIDCADWNDRKWMQLCGVMKSEVIDCDLFWFKENDLEIYAYPIEEQISCISKRSKCRVAQLDRWERHRNRSPSTSPSQNEERPSTEGRREEETRGEEEETHFLPPHLLLLYFTDKGCFAPPEELEWFTKAYNHFSDNFLNMVIRTCKEQRSSKGLKPKPCKSDLMTELEKQKKNFKDGVYRNQPDS